jgi:hypothetical protein
MPLPPKEIAHKALELLKSQHPEERETGFNQIMQMMEGGREDKMAAFRAVARYPDRFYSSNPPFGYPSGINAALSRHIVASDRKMAYAAMKATEKLAKHAALLDLKRIHSPEASQNDKDGRAEVIARLNHTLNALKATYRGDSRAMAKVLMDAIESPYQTDGDVTRLFSITNAGTIELKKPLFEEIAKRRNVFRKIPDEYALAIFQSLVNNVGLHRVNPNACDEQTSRAALKAAWGYIKLGSSRDLERIRNAFAQDAGERRLHVHNITMNKLVFRKRLEMLHKYGPHPA